VTGDNGSCSGSGSVTVGVSGPPTVTAIASPATICAGTSSTLTASGNANVYQWNTGQTGATITVSPSTTTTYYVAGYNGFNCRGIAQVVVTVDATGCSGASGARVASNGEPDTSSTIAVYPNPSKGVLYIKNAPKDSQVEIFNQVGQRIAAGTIEDIDEPAEINLTQNLRGIYFIRISQSNKSVYQGRIIKIE